MPRRATTRPTTRRSAPYQLRSVNNTTQPSNMTVTVSPMVNWEQMATQHHGYLPAPPQQTHYDHYSQQVLLQDYQTMPTTLSAAPPVQHIRAPIYTDAHANAHFNPTTATTGSGPWTTEMDDILLDNHKRMKWDQIAERYFNNAKTGNACRKRHARIMNERKEPSRWPPERVNKVIEAYKRGNVRERMWKILADEVGEEWTHVEKLCLNQGVKAMTRDEGSRHTRRRSQAPSHRSHPSINSDLGQHDDFEDDPTDDSGLGGDIRSNNMQRIRSQPVQSQTYTTQSGSYHDNLSTGYDTDSYAYR